MRSNENGATSIFAVMIAWLKSLFAFLFRRGKHAAAPAPPATGTIPHPEEPPDYSKTTANTTLEGLLAAWFKEWKVPERYQGWWRSEMKITISLQYANPASTSSETRQMWIRPEWANPGVIAHELAHVSYSLLTEKMKAGFASTHERLKKSDPLIVLLYSHNTYGLTNDVEGHAEVYRYLGEKMPDGLKRYYPNLF